MKHEEARSTIEERVRETVEDRSDIHNVHLLVHSGSRDIQWNMAFGKTGDHQAVPDQPYHAASVGKTYSPARNFSKASSARWPSSHRQTPRGSRIWL